MIYIFQGLGKICSLPAMACKGCGEACKSMNCKPIQDCCNNVSNGCKGFTQKPLCAYVIIIYAVCAYEIFTGYTALSNLDCADSASTCDMCKASGLNGKTIGMVLTGFGVLNLIFAPYMMTKVWKKVMESIEAEPDSVKVDKQGQRFIPKDAVQSAFKDVFMKDFFVLAFFFISLGHMYLASIGQTGASASECADVPGMGSDGLTMASNLGRASFAITCIFTLTYYCCTCCSGSVILSDDVAESMDIKGTETTEPMNP
jgi:hypothetical protein